MDLSGEAKLTKGWFIKVGATGSDTNIYYNGEPVEGVSQLQIEVGAGDITRLILEFIPTNEDIIAIVKGEDINLPRESVRQIAEHNGYTLEPDDADLSEEFPSDDVSYLGTEDEEPPF